MADSFVLAMELMGFNGAEGVCYRSVLSVLFNNPEYVSNCQPVPSEAYDW